MIESSHNRTTPRVVIDTSVILPILILNQPGVSRLLQLWQNSRILPLHNQDTIAELRGKLLENSPTVKHDRAVRFVDAALRRYSLWSQQVPLEEGEPDRTRPQCRDPSDQKFIDLAIIGKADFLIAKDPDLLSLNSCINFQILTEDAFMRTICP